MNFFEVFSVVGVTTLNFVIFIPFAGWIGAPGWMAVVVGLASSVGTLWVLSTLTSKEKTSQGDEKGTDRTEIKK
jgi:hypothetical protein